MSDTIPEHIAREAFVVHVDLRGATPTVAEIYAGVSGFRPEHGAKPWPHYRDADTGEWWSLNTAHPTRLDRLAWLMDLHQLAYHSRPEARAFLEGVLPELAAAATSIGGLARPEGSVDDALRKMAEFEARRAITEAEALILVAAPAGNAFPVRAWWDALQGAGLALGDGNLFWHYDADGNELFCAEPFTRLGYFHRGDLDSNVTFPDVALRFRVRTAEDPERRLEAMHGYATAVATTLGAQLLDAEGNPFDLAKAVRRVTALCASFVVRPP